jgi:predicted metal-dependent phosphoesterase TrpH
MMSPARLVRHARSVGLDRIAITDHGAVAGALEAAAIDPELVIVGEEVSCRGGAHLIGLFLHKRIPNGLSVAETAQRIRDQGGVVYAPHPFAYLRSVARRAEAVLEVADVVEVFNARAFVPSWNARAMTAALERALPSCAGTDGHFPWELGRVYTRMPAFADAATFLASAARSELYTPATTPTLTHVASVTIQVARLLMGSVHGSPPPLVGRGYAGVATTAPALRSE